MPEDRDSLLDSPNPYAYRSSIICDGLISLDAKALFSFVDEP